MTSHVHAEHMKKYAEDAAVSVTPWKFWQYRKIGNDNWQNFQDCMVDTANPRWGADYEYRRVLRKPQCMKNHPSIGQKYYIPLIGFSDCLIDSVRWYEDSVDMRMFDNELVFETELEARRCAEWLLNQLKQKQNEQ